VVGVSIVGTSLQFLVKDDHGDGRLEPAAMFAEFEAQLPAGWLFALEQGVHVSERQPWGGEFVASWGYREFVEDPQHLAKLVDEEPEAVAIFERHITKAEMEDTPETYLSQLTRRRVSSMSDDERRESAELLLREAGRYIANVKLEDARDLVGYGEVAEGAANLAWTIVQDQTDVPPHVITAIHCFTTDVIPYEHMPSNLDTFALPEE
jgi:hypothetical protein